MDCDVARWTEPYLETCCRAALHRLTLAGLLGRPAGLQDGPCLERIAGMGLARLRGDGRYEPTAGGLRRHATEVLRQVSDAAPDQTPRGRR
jgi:hypothetical protein